MGRRDLLAGAHEQGIGTIGPTGRHPMPPTPPRPSPRRRNRRPGRPDFHNCSSRARAPVASWKIGRRDLFLSHGRPKTGEP